MTNEYEILKRNYRKKTIDLKTNANFKTRLMKFSNNLEVDVVYHLWAAVLIQSIRHAFKQFGSFLAGPLGLEIRYSPDRTDRNMCIGQTEQTEIWVLARPNRPKYGYWPDRTDQNMGIGQTEQTEIWVLARPNRTKIGYWPPDRTDRNMGICQTEQTKIWVLARRNRPKYGYSPDRSWKRST